MSSAVQSSVHEEHDSSVPSALSMSMVVMLVLWTLTLLLSPLYVFPSGIPQPADFLSVIVLFCLYTLGRLRWDISAHETLKRLAQFVAYACAINFTWSALLYGFYGRSREFPLDMLLTGIYYFFNLCIATAVASMVFWMGRIFIVWTMWAIIVSSTIQAVAAWQFGVDELHGRTTAFFDNPNQLAYFAVLNASLLMVLSRSGRASRILNWLMPISLLLLVYLAIASSSRAGLAGIFLACVLLYIDSWFRGLLLTLFVGGVLISGVLDPVLESLSSRAAATQGFWEEVANRGYDRIWNHPEYLVFGAGEGQTDRLNTENPQLELHSTPGTLLFSYGLVGTILFLRPFGYLVRTKGLPALMMFVPVLVYGLTHNGLRQSELWMLITLIGCNLADSLGHADEQQEWLDEESNNATHGDSSFDA